MRLQAHLRGAAESALREREEDVDLYPEARRIASLRSWNQRRVRDSQKSVVHNLLLLCTCTKFQNYPVCIASSLASLAVTHMDSRFADSV